ncbi:MAG: alpha/beta fold hydrolase [Pseudomonadota bacterium]
MPSPKATADLYEPGVSAFDDLLPRVADLAEQGDLAGLEGMVPKVEQLTEQVTGAPDGWRGAEVIPFRVSSTGFVTHMTAAAAEGLKLAPGDNFVQFLNSQGRRVFEEVVDRGGGESLVTAPIMTHGRAALVGISKTRYGVAARALLTFWRPEISDALRADFRLSEAEVEVARELFGGLRPKAIAELRGRSAETVRSQIKAIFAKMGVSGILEFAHLIYGLNAHATAKTTRSKELQSGEARLWRGPEWPIDVYCDGDPAGRPLIFFHGCLGGRIFAEDARKMLSHRFIIAPGRPGHGRTPEASTEVSQLPEIAARQALSIMDNFDVRRADIVAHDVGAATALTLAQIAPERVGKVLNVAALPPMPEIADTMNLPRQQRVFPILSRVSKRAGQALARLGGERLLTGGPASFGEVVFAGCKVDIAACKRMEVAELYWRGHGWHTIQGPTGFFTDASLSGTAWDRKLGPAPDNITFFHGQHDQSAPLSLVEALASRVGGDLRIVPQAGHSLLHAHPEIWASELK